MHLILKHTKKFGSQNNKYKTDFKGIKIQEPKMGTTHLVCTKG